MKTFVYIALFIILGSFVFNVVSMDFKQSLLGSYNRPYIIGICSGICGIILCFIFLNYYRLKANLEKKS
jgi:hypothetical protein